MIQIKTSRISVVTITFVLISFFFFCADDNITNNNQTTAGKATVKAVITDNSSSNPIQGAYVTIYNTIRGVAVDNATTDNQGISHFVVNADTSYYLTVTASGYNPHPYPGNPNDTFDVTQNDTTVQTIKLREISKPTVVKVFVYNDSTNAAIENASVTIFEDSTETEIAKGTTNGSGFCYLTVETGYSYYLNVSMDGHLPYPRPGSIPVPFQVGGTNDTTAQNVGLSKINTPAEVKVVVTDDSTNNPIENAAITIFNYSNNQVAGTGLTNSLGEYVFDVEGGFDYYVKVSAGSYHPYPLLYQNAEVFNVAANASVVYNVSLTKLSPHAIVVVSVMEDSTAIPINKADVVIYSSNTGLSHSRDMTDSEGQCVFFVEPNLPYSLRVSAQEYMPSPPFNGNAIPFQVGDSGSIKYRNFALKKDSLAIDAGTIDGYILSATGVPIAGALIIAINQDNSRTVCGISGPDGYYILYNVPPGTYDIEVHTQGYYQTTSVTSITVTTGNTTSNVGVTLTAVTGAGLEGRITFLASQNSLIDITLVHPESHIGIPGLNTIMVDGNNYTIDSIPPGTYIPWASYQNDGYVMDPDWIRKFGLPTLTFNEGDSTIQELNFSVTNAVTIISPTNHPDTLIPVYIQNTVPTFKWEAYSSTQEYIVGVYNSYGELIWGGYDTSNNVLHPNLGTIDTVVFNFDSSATEPIKWGRTYRWKVWADKGGDDGVQQLISASEDLMGLFTLSERREEWTGYKKR